MKVPKELDVSNRSGSSEVFSSNNPTPSKNIFDAKLATFPITEQRFIDENDSQKAKDVQTSKEAYE